MPSSIVAVKNIVAWDSFSFENMIMEYISTINQELYSIEVQYSPFTEQGQANVSVLIICREV